MTGRKRFEGEILRRMLTGGRIGFVTGPARVGKSSCCAGVSDRLLDWDEIGDRAAMLQGPEAVARRLGLARRRDEAVVVLENLHGHRDWTALIRGLRAHCGPRLRLAITTALPLRVPGRQFAASAFLLRLHPWSVGEAVRDGPLESLLRPSAQIAPEDWIALLEHGGFPEPFARRELQFSGRWRARQRQQILDHLPMLTGVRHASLAQMLVVLLGERSATHLVYSDLSRQLAVAVDTLRRWIDLLADLQFGFLVRPWFNGVPKALRKEPKWFLRDWSSVDSPARERTFIACQLLKAAHVWTDLGFGRFELRYVADKAQREVDFLLVRNRKPWFLVEVAQPGMPGSLAMLEHFQRCTRSAHAFQIRMDLPYQNVDCFAQDAPISIPARTLLSQLP